MMERKEAEDISLQRYMECLGFEGEFKVVETSTRRVILGWDRGGILPMLISVHDSVDKANQERNRLERSLIIAEYTLIE